MSTLGRGEPSSCRTPSACQADSGLRISSPSSAGSSASGTLTRDIVGKTPKEYRCDAVNWATAACRKYKVELTSIENPKEVKPPKPPNDFKKKLFEVANDMEQRLKKVEKAQKQLEKSKKPTSVDEALALISGYEELIHGVAFARIGQYRFQLIKRYKKFWKRMQRYHAYRSRFRRGRRLRRGRRGGAQTPFADGSRFVTYRM